MKLLAKYGISFLDNKLQGIFDYDFVVIGADSGVGKTTLANMLTFNIHNQGVKVALFSLEDTQGDFKRKLICQKYREVKKPFITYREWCSDTSINDFDEQKWADDKVKDLDIVEAGEELFTIDRVAELFEKKALEGCKVFIIDHLDYFVDTEDNEIKNVRKIMMILRKLQMKYQVGVIAFSQFAKNRQKDVKIPSYFDLYGSGDKYKQATVVLNISRDEEYSCLEQGMYSTFFAVRKDRYGFPVSARLFFDAKTGKYLKRYDNIKVNFQGTKIQELDK